MKILFAIKAMDEAKGGAERVLADLASGLARRGHDITVLSYDAPGGESYFPLHPVICRISLGLGRSHQPARLVETLVRMRTLRRVVTGQRPDVVVGFMHSMFLPLGLALAGCGIPLIASEHIIYAHYQDLPVQRLLLHFTPNLSDCITVLSESIRRSYPANLQRHMCVIPNPVSISVVSQADVTGKDQARKILLSVGRLTAQKDQRTLVTAFAHLAGAFHDWDLRIIGEGELRPALERQIAELGLLQRIHLPGTRADIGREYAASQLFVMPSLYESFGLATAEALSYGLPAVGFADCPGTNEIIHHGHNGLLVDGTDRVEALAAGLERLMADPEERMRLSAEAPASVLGFDIDHICDRWESLLQSISGDTDGR